MCLETNHLSNFEHFENRETAYNSGGTSAVRNRGKAEINAAVQEAHGGSGAFPLIYTPSAANGNMLESNEIAKRHFVCGDPPNVSVQHEVHSAVVRGFCCSSDSLSWLASETSQFAWLGLPQWALNQLYTPEVETALPPRSRTPCPYRARLSRVTETRTAPLTGSGSR